MNGRTVVWLITVGTIALLGTVRAGAGGGDGVIPGAVVRTTLADAERDYELRAAALSAGGATTEIIMASRPKGRRPGAESLVWASVDAAGRVLSQQNPLAPLPAAEAADASLGDPAAGSGFAFLRGRGLFLLPAAHGGLRLVRLARPNDPAAARDIDVGTAPNIRRVLASGDERLVLVGSVGAKALVTAVNAEGKTVAEHAPGAEGMTAVGATFEADGSMVVAGEQGRFPTATTWVGRVSPRGVILARASFAGRPADIARGSDGTYVVVVERGGPEGSEILLKALAPFRVAPVTTGGYIIAGAKDRGLWVSRVKADGAEVWVEAHDPLTSPDLEVVSHMELASAQDVFVTAYTAFVVNGREQREVVRAVRFKAN
jgi:hypothetical protein